MGNVNFFSGLFTVEVKEPKDCFLDEFGFSEGKRNFKVLIFPTEVFVDFDGPRKVVFVPAVFLDKSKRFEKTVIPVKNLILSMQIARGLIDYSRLKGYIITINDIYDLFFLGFSKN
jgi:hypothetical protein